jgi:hypothetical protein
VVLVSSVANVDFVTHSSAVFKPRRPFLPDRYFFITVRLLKHLTKFTEADFALFGAPSIERGRPTRRDADPKTGGPRLLVSSFALKADDHNYLDFCTLAA